jgi:opacity protein-like surface antigen
MSSRNPLPIALGLVLALTAADARAQLAEEDSLKRRAVLGGNVVGAFPTGAFKNYVETGFGLGGYFLYAFDQDGAFGLRVDFTWVQYGSETQRQPLVPRIMVDVTTRNHIYSALAGPQLTLRSGFISPYLNAGLGLSYFETRSSISGTEDLDQDFASTRHFYDTTFAWAVGGGICFAVARNTTLELAAHYLWNGQVNYLREGSITEQSDGSISFNPIESETNLVLVQLGISFAVM